MRTLSIPKGAQRARRTARLETGAEILAKRQPAGVAPMRYIVRNGKLFGVNGWYVYDAICHFVVSTPGDRENAQREAEELNRADKLKRRLAG